MNKFLLISISKLQISTEPVWLLSLIVCCALVKSPNTNVRCRIVLHSTFLPSQRRLSTSITFSALNKFRRKLSRLRRMRFTTPRWRVLLYATSTLSAALLLHYQVHARIWRNLQMCWPTATTKSLSNCRAICEIVCMKLFHYVSADYPWEKSRITAYVKTTKNVMNYRRLMTYLRNR